MTHKADAIRKLAIEVAVEILTDGMGVTAKRVALDYSGRGGGTGRNKESIVDEADRVLRKSPLLRRPK